jgi:type II secretory pathway component PulJ
MKHLNFGFTALEMILSIMISAMLMTAALTIYSQITKSLNTLQRVSHLDTQAMIVRQRLYTDLQGLLPLWFSTEHYEQLKKTAKSNKESEKNETAPPSQGSKKRNNFLYAQSHNNQLEILTFVTTNAIQVFAEKQPRTVRVVYALRPDMNQTFKLMRREEEAISSDFDIEQLKTGHFYKIADKISSCMIEYGFLKQEKDKKTTEFTFVKEWGDHEEQKKDETKKPLMPDVLKLTLKMQYQPNQEIKTYEILCSIATCHASTIKSFAQIRQEQTQQAKTPTAQTPAAPPNSPTPQPPAAQGAAKNVIQGGAAAAQFSAKFTAKMPTPKARA